MNLGKSIASIDKDWEDLTHEEQIMLGNLTDYTSQTIILSHRLGLDKERFIRTMTRMYDSYSEYAEKQKEK